QLMVITNLKVMLLTPNIISITLEIREECLLSFFDSHQVTTVLIDAGVLIGTYESFLEIEGLTMIFPSG
ncbi:hypothetical protein LCGC14_0529420, partial [marine sediment metagenome]